MLLLSPLSHFISLSLSNFFLLLSALSSSNPKPIQFQHFFMLSQISLFPSKKKSQISFAMDSDGFVMDSFLTLPLISHLSFSFKACTRAGFGLWSQHGDRWINVSVNHGLGGGVGLDRWRLVSYQCHQWWVAQDCWWWARCGVMLAALIWWRRGSNGFVDLGFVLLLIWVLCGFCSEAWIDFYLLGSDGLDVAMIWWFFFFF